MIRTLEELSLNAWPALQTCLLDGWVLRLSAGYTRRANSVQPLYAGTQPPAEKIRAAEAVYRARGQDTVFKLTAAAAPSGLDAVLAAAGYTWEAPTHVQTLRLERREPAALTGRLSATDAGTPAWLDAFCTLNGSATRHRPALERMLASIIPARRFLLLEQDDAPAALGLAVAEQGYVGLFDIVTAPPLRNQGLGRQVVDHLLAWGQAQGARQAYLQVMDTNAPARHLYARLGFADAYPYWYRVKRMLGDTPAAPMPMPQDS